jgi:hypothetical protein
VLLKYLTCPEREIGVFRGEVNEEIARSKKPEARRRTEKAKYKNRAKRMAKMAGI